MARLFFVSVVATFVLAGGARGEDARESFFELKVRPVLTTECLPCHGGEKTKSGLKLDSRGALYEAVIADRRPWWETPQQAC